MASIKKPLGSITVICGSMFSGKTEELIRLVRRAMHARKCVQVFKSALETRCETTLIRTHDGISFIAQAVPDARTLESLLLPEVQVVGIEEVQFLDEAIVPLCQRLADRGVQVIAAGLDQDFRGLPFSFMPTLLALADDVLKLHAICMVCGEEAGRTQRLVDGRPAAWDEPTILIGAEETYEARCRRCHRVRNVPRPVRVGAEGRARKNGHGGAEAVADPCSADRTQLEMFEAEAAVGTVPGGIEAEGEGRGERL
jgi:thymidine kinase